MFCRYCGKEIEQTNLFCEHCGARLGSVTPEPPVDNSAPPMQTAPMASAVKTAKPLKKKSILILLGISIAVLLAVIIGPKDSAETPPIASPVEDFEYVLQDGVAIITGYIGTDLDIVIPSVIEDRPVVQINDSAFKDYDLKSVYIPDSIIYICSQAFSSCKLLESVRMSTNLEELEMFSFADCESLKEISLPKSLKIIPEQCFRNCTSLTDISFSEGLETIDEYAFKGCTSLSSVKLPSSVKSIGNGVFMNCNNLKKVFIPSQNVSLEYLVAYNNYDKYFASPFDSGVTLVIKKGSQTDLTMKQGLYRYDGADMTTSPITAIYTKIDIEIIYD